VTAPTPPADLAARTPRILHLATGAQLHRFYTAAYEPLYFDRSLEGRLNAPDATYGVLYAAEEMSGAFAETFLRKPGLRQLDPGLLARKAYVRLQTTRSLTLIELAGPGLAILGATAEVVHGGLPYDVPQGWSRALHSLSLMADGIAYNARHDDRALCYALFDRISGHLTEVERRVDLDSDWFWELADIYQIGYPPPT
jgi:hypothetical protein